MLLPHCLRAYQITIPISTHQNRPKSTPPDPTRPLPTFFSRPYPTPPDLNRPHPTLTDPTRYASAQCRGWLIYQLAFMEALTVAAEVVLTMRRESTAFTNIRTWRDIGLQFTSCTTRIGWSSGASYSNTLAASHSFCTDFSMSLKKSLFVVGNASCSTMNKGVHKRKEKKTNTSFLFAMVLNDLIEKLCKGPERNK